jgi:hypothetical protein
VPILNDVDARRNGGIDDRVGRLAWVDGPLERSRIDRALQQPVEQFDSGTFLEYMPGLSVSLEDALSGS